MSEEMFIIDANMSRTLGQVAIFMLFVFYFCGGRRGWKEAVMGV